MKYDLSKKNNLFLKSMIYHFLIEFYTIFAYYYLLFYIPFSIDVPFQCRFMSLICFAM